MSNHSMHMLSNRVSVKGYPVVFLHGFLESSSMWDGIMIENCRCIYIDLPGHGASSSIDSDESMQSMAAKVLDVLNQYQLEQFTIIGHSMGGYVGLEILKQSTNCEQLILLNSNFWEDDETKRRDRDRVSNIVMKKKASFIYEAIPNLFDDPTLFDNEVKALIAEAMHMTEDAIAICSLAMKSRSDYTDMIIDNSNRVTVIQGNHDPVVERDKMRKIVEATQIDYYEVASGHMAHLEARSDVNGILNKKITETY